MALSNPLPLRPFTLPASGEAAVPGSKSLTNRMLALAALGQGPLTLKGALFSEDTRLMAAALRALGFAVREDPSLSTIAVEGLGGGFRPRARTSSSASPGRRRGSSPPCAPRRPPESSGSTACPRCENGPCAP